MVLADPKSVAETAVRLRVSICRESAVYNVATATAAARCCVERDQSSSRARGAEAQEGLGAHHDPAGDVRGESEEASPGGDQRPDRPARAAQPSAQQVSSHTQHTTALTYTVSPPPKKTTLMSDAIALTISTDFNNFLAELLLSEAIKW